MLFLSCLNCGEEDATQSPSGDIKPSHFALRRYKTFLRKVAPEVASYYIPSIPRQRVPSRNKSASFAKRNAAIEKFVLEAGPPFK